MITFGSPGIVRIINSHDSPVGIVQPVAHVISAINKRAQFKIELKMGGGFVISVNINAVVEPHDILGGSGPDVGLIPDIAADFKSRNAICGKSRPPWCTEQQNQGGAHQNNQSFLFHHNSSSFFRRLIL